MEEKGKKLIVVGAGPVGSLAALYGAKRGYDVHVYDLRADLRHLDTTPLNFTKSINLALSERGINGIRSSGHEVLLETVLAQTIPMHGRMIHTRTPTGALSEESQAYDIHGRFQRSVDRGGLNVCLLNELNRLPNVTFHFQQKLTGADFNKNKAWFEDQTVKASEPGQRKSESEVSFDLMLGCDGAHSAVRYHMMKFARMNYQQEYIDCLWCEFSMPPQYKQVGNPTTGESSIEPDFQISPNHLHIWPAGSFMFIALPNLDKSFVCTLFGPVSLYTQLETANEADLTEFFDTNFPGVTSLIPPADLHAQFHRNPHLPLINIKCSPHHHSGSVAILGDAAHAMVPFYGQGMNAGLESVRVLFECLDRHSDFPTALTAYTKTRVTDAHAIADLAMGNYHEMRSAVTSPLYKLRKFLEERLDFYFPRAGWATQYARVSFSNLPYSEVVARARRQKHVLQTWVAGLAGLGGSVAVVAVILAVLRARAQVQSNAGSAGFIRNLLNRVLRR